MFRRAMTLGAAVVTAATIAAAQTPAPRPQSPAGSAQTQVGGTWSKNARGGDVYQNGKWVEITYGRPIKRGRELFGSGADYAKNIVRDGAKVWRAGANVTTRLKSEAPLEIGGKKVPAGDYSLFIDTKSPSDWTLIVSSWAAQEKYDPNNKDALWGSFEYTPDKDVARAPMTVGKLPISVDQLTWNFADVTATGGKLVLMWDTVVATVPFKVAQ
jgi:Protein of unknown function (DUF2911)